MVHTGNYPECLWWRAASSVCLMLLSYAGPLVVDALRPLTDAPLDTHLMIVEPEQRVGRSHSHYKLKPT